MFRVDEVRRQTLEDAARVALRPVHPWEAAGRLEREVIAERILALAGSPTCASCGNPYHEASGHRLSSRTLICGPCARHFMAWLKQHTRRRWGGQDFYALAATSIRA